MLLRSADVKIFMTSSMLLFPTEFKASVIDAVTLIVCFQSISDSEKEIILHYQRIN